MVLTKTLAFTCSRQQSRCYIATKTENRAIRTVHLRRYLYSLKLANLTSRHFVTVGHFLQNLHVFPVSKLLKTS